MKIVLLFISIIISINSLQAVELKWEIPENQRLEIVKTARVVFLLNNRQKKIYEERNIIDLTCYKNTGDLSYVNGVFSIFQRNSGNSVFYLKEQSLSDFIIEKSGKFKVEKKYYMPNLRHVPTFPEGDIKIDERWNAKGELVLNNFSRPFKLIFPVEYHLNKIGKIKLLDVAFIDYKFKIEYDLRNIKVPGDFPLKIIAKNDGVIHWDIKNNKPLNINDQYKIVFIFKHGRRNYVTQGFEMNILTQNKMYTPFKEKDKELAQKELKKELEDDRGIDVDTEERGLVLRMGEILFDFDSHKIRKDTKKTLNKIIEILKRKYPDREIIVEGHTDNSGSKKYNQKLSEKRAQSVAQYLKNKGKKNKLSYRGFGQENPIDNNKTKSGRQKNRRVEIIIKLK